MDHDSIYQEFFKKIVKSFQNDFDDRLPDNLVVPSDCARWIDPAAMPSAARVGPMVDLPTRSFEISLQEIPAHSATDLQRHSHEAVHYVISGLGYSEIGARSLPWKEGDFIYTPVWAWHRHYNSSTAAARLIVIENSRLLEVLGLHQRQSAGLIDYATYRRNATKDCSEE